MPRDSRESRAAKANSLLSDPMLVEAFDRYETSIINLLKEANLNGMESAADYTLELARKLQTIKEVKKRLQSEIDNLKVLRHNENIKSA